MVAGENEDPEPIFLASSTIENKEEPEPQPQSEEELGKARILSEAELLFGKSKTKLLDVLSQGVLGIRELTQARRQREEVSSQENSTTRTILAALGFDLPSGIEIRNGIGQDGKTDPDSFFLFPEGISLERILEAKKEENAQETLEKPRFQSASQTIQDEARLKEPVSAGPGAFLTPDTPEPAGDRKAEEAEVLIPTAEIAMEPEVAYPIEPEITDEKPSEALERVLILMEEEILGAESKIDLVEILGGQNVANMFEKLIGSNNGNPIRIQEVTRLLYPERKKIKLTAIEDAQKKILELNRELLDGTGVEIRYAVMDDLEDRFLVWLLLPKDKSITTIEQLGAYIKDLKKPVGEETATLLNERSEAKPVEPEDAMRSLPRIAGRFLPRRKGGKAYLEPERKPRPETVLYKSHERVRFEPIVISDDPRNMDIQVNGAKIRLPFGRQRALLEHLKNMVGQELNGQDLTPRGSGMSQEIAIANFSRLREIINGIPGMTGALEILGNGRYKKFRINSQVLIA